jgi:2-polyprenyl-3-methyl-5-hydroxy-6-metoxy-1,4-benzoquinol methylase
MQNPAWILKPHLCGAKSIVDLGCGPGYFTIPMARMAEEGARVTAVDLQPEMLEITRKRAAEAGVSERIEFHNSSETDIGLPAGTADFALSFWMVHETLDPAVFVRQAFALLKPGGRLLLVEPVMHVSRAQFEATLGFAAAAGFEIRSRPFVAISRAALLVHPAASV